MPFPKGGHHSEATRAKIREALARNPKTGRPVRDCQTCHGLLSHTCSGSVVDWCSETLKAHRERGRKYDKARYSNPERRAKVRLANRKTKHLHPERVAECRRIRRARRRGADTDGHTRAEVFERDGGRCQMCGVILSPDNWHEDHIVPLARGGSDLLENCQATCPPCNLSKGARAA